MHRPHLSIIAAVACNGAIGKNNALLVHLPDDLPRFKRLTMGAPLLMGRKTWDSIGRPLPGRRSIVITRNPQWQAAGAEPADSWSAALNMVGSAPQAFVIGGAEIYALALPHADELLLTEIDADFEADAFFPPWSQADFVQTSSQENIGPQGLRYRFSAYARRSRRSEDAQWTTA
jgi:dihydrofolate reductase